MVDYNIIKYTKKSEKRDMQTFVDADHTSDLID